MCNPRIAHPPVAIPSGHPYGPFHPPISSTPIDGETVNKTLPVVILKGSALTFRILLSCQVAAKPYSVHLHLASEIQPPKIT